MTNKDKQLLLVDLSARLPYGVKVAEFDDNGHKTSITAVLQWVDASDSSIYENLKPYLRPMSSMTEEEEIAYLNLEGAARIVDWLNKNHFDYRGLIPMGLALEAPRDMY